MDQTREDLLLNHAMTESYLINSPMKDYWKILWVGLNIQKIKYNLYLHYE